jgi:hypothetical protein
MIGFINLAAQMNGCPVDPAECQHRGAAPFDTECGKCLHIGSLDKKGVGQHLRTDDRSLPSSSVESNFLHSPPFRAVSSALHHLFLQSGYPIRDVLHSAPWILRPGSRYSGA